MHLYNKETVTYCIDIYGISWSKEKCAGIRFRMQLENKDNAACRLLLQEGCDVLAVCSKLLFYRCNIFEGTR